MKLLEISDNEVVTMDDYPIHDLRDGDSVITKLYFRIFQEGCARIIARVVLLPKGLVLTAFDKKIKNKFAIFEKKNPQMIPPVHLDTILITRLTNVFLS